MRIILNADDFGASKDTVEATAACFARGELTSATLMAGMPAIDEALAFARGHPQYSFGVHLTLAGDGAERPLCPPARVSSLLDQDFQAFPPAREQRRRALMYSIFPHEIEREVRAQIERVIDAGVRVTHVDSHHHLHKFPLFLEVLLRVLPDYAIRRVRGVQDVYLRRSLRSPTSLLSPLWSASMRRGLRRARCVTTRHLYLPSSTGDACWAAALLRRLSRVGPGRTLEIGVHPGTQEPWRSDEALEAGAFARGALRAGHELITWAEI